MLFYGPGQQSQRPPLTELMNVKKKYNYKLMQFPFIGLNTLKFVGGKLIFFNSNILLPTICLIIRYCSLTGPRPQLSTPLLPRTLIPYFSRRFVSTTPAKSENPRILHTPPAKKVLVLFVFFVSLQKHCDGSCFFFPFELLQHQACLEDLFEV